MDTSYLSQQVNTIIGQLHGLFDEIGVPSHEREHRESEVNSSQPYPKRCITNENAELVQALESYSSHLEPTFVKIALPPTGPNQSIPPSFDLSPSYVDKLDSEFTRVYEEYTRRVATVKALSEHIIQLWAELGTPQAQTDGAIVKYYRDAPEQLGLHEEDLARLRTKRDKLADEKKNREKRLRDLKVAVEALWEKLGIEEKERKAFLNSNRGCGVRQINEFEDELARLNELKRQNLHLFVEDARYKLQELWDALYFSEDEMLEFTPAFSDVYSDALLEAHEREIAKLETLKEQRAPTLALVDRHRTLVHDRDELAASSQDASRLMMRGQKGEKRDPGKLLREEKMRKRIAKELPKVAAELRKMLDKWEDEYGRPFLVHGERYLDVIEADDPKSAPGPRAKTPAGPPPSTTKSAKGGMLSRANSVGKGAQPSRAGAKTPTAAHSTIPKKAQPSNQGNNLKGSPSRIPARVPLSNLKNGNNSPERARPQSRADGGVMRPGAPLMRAPPPKMRDLVPVPQLETPANPYRSAGLGSSIVRQVEPEDVYDDRPLSQHEYSRPPSHHDYHASMRPPERMIQSSYPQAPPARQISNTSTAVSGSENWETYDDNSEPEQDASDTYYAKVRAARSKRASPETGYGRSYASQSKRLRGFPPASHAGHVMVDHDGNRIISGSEWTDEDAF
ncbi:putative microtubule associated protein [Phaeoacremonium minimum UCRPA7]|uniref:Putative microtubule associated protein n=1 Tax=Phaeoacremonium minimum (strain UCR-PA7) TaxID=1286976 RepID=R8BIP7_PHAM7|nr:putative microtubule associated protein [Phaeoacremonium minimum UCRPA7]EON99149.1 putative microtubule associated protein [Phaeoacremonium minimum UCRPA7]